MLERYQKCKKCEKVLFKEVTPDGANWLMSAEMPLDLKSDDNDKFYECPHCGAKNVIVSRSHKEGEPPQYEIASWKE
jgi:DNA-directed RNA polymerase subunit RPC12/RpoP